MDRGHIPGETSGHVRRHRADVHVSDSVRGPRAGRERATEGHTTVHPVIIGALEPRCLGAFGGKFHNHVGKFAILWAPNSKEVKEATQVGYLADEPK